MVLACVWYCTVRRLQIQLESMLIQRLMAGG